jgi:hypothetical protein
MLAPRGLAALVFEEGSLDPNAFDEDSVWSMVLMWQFRLADAVWRI